ncbi:MAG: glycoside hydrolase family 76 protein, partial [Cytophagales bacterium]|jgi:rhamnogalacturonyl hydrolase YesR|nr:glycoside hydrolase family 76 protein [Cytophagales bacterium]
MNQKAENSIFSNVKTLLLKVTPRRDWGRPFLFFLWLGSHAYAQTYSAKASELQQRINEQFYDKAAGFYTDVHRDERKYSELWALCCWIQVANELEKADSTQPHIPGFLQLMGYYFSEAAPAPGYASYILKYGGGDRYYDDNQWIGIALMDAYARTKKTEYLQKATVIYNFMMTAHDRKTGGGLYWREKDKLTKNTCSNAPGAILALQLYQATKQKKYLKIAQRLYQWTNRWMRSPEGLYYDNVVVKNDSIDKRTYSYNTGTMLQTNVYLYEITGQPKYLTEAQTIAKAAVQKFYSAQTFTDDYWFNAVMLRAFQHLRKFDPNDSYLQAFQKRADTAWQNERNANGTMGKTEPVNLVNQVGMVEILLRMAEINSELRIQN